MKLKLEHLVPYLLHGVSFYVEHKDGTPMKPWTMTIDSDLRQIIEFQNKPILRPLSDLTKDIKHNSDTFVPILLLYNISRRLPQDTIIEFEYIESWGGDLILRHNISDIRHNDFIYSGHCFNSHHTDSKIKTNHLNKVENQYFLHERLFEWHFDVFGLIDKELAVDINTIKPSLGKDFFKLLND